MNNCESLKFKFPDTHEGQDLVAKGCKDKSKAGFNNCVGCINCMLICTNKPGRRVLEGEKIVPIKFFCGRKKKYGLVIQATCDHHRRFLDIDLQKSATTTDYLIFYASDFWVFERWFDSIW